MTTSRRASILLLAVACAALATVTMMNLSTQIESAGVAEATTTDPPSTTTPSALHALAAAYETMLRSTTTTLPPTTTTTAPPRRVQAASVGPSGDRFDALAQCESGGDPRAVSASGTYRGAFQFSLSTWHSIGRTGDPIDYSYEEQKAAAIDLQARSGWGQWPACSRKLGYR